jgi:hypothetical protein
MVAVTSRSSPDGDAPKTTLSEMQALVIELRRLLAELERAIQDQLQQGRK